MARTSMPTPRPSSRRYRGAASQSSCTMLAPRPRTARRNQPRSIQAGWRNWSSGCAKSPSCAGHSAWTLAATAGRPLGLPRPGVKRPSTSMRYGAPPGGRAT
jgi:hypothetical protein